MAYTYNPLTNDLLEMVDLYDDPFIDDKTAKKMKKV